MTSKNNLITYFQFFFFFFKDISTFMLAAWLGYPTEIHEKKHILIFIDSLRHGVVITDFHLLLLAITCFVYFVLPQFVF